MRYRSNQGGVSMVEFLVAMIIVSIMLLAAFTVYVRSAQQMETSYQESYVNQQMEAASNALLAGDKVFVANWQNNIAQHLPSGQAKINRMAGLYFIHISWFDRWQQSEKTRVYTVLAL